MNCTQCKRHEAPNASAFGRNSPGDCFSDARRSASVFKAKYGGMEAWDVKRLKELEDENRRLKQMYADLSLKSQLQAEIIKKL